MILLFESIQLQSIFIEIFDPNERDRRRNAKKSTSFSSSFFSSSWECESIFHSISLISQSIQWIWWWFRVTLPSYSPFQSYSSTTTTTFRLRRLSKCTFVCLFNVFNKIYTFSTYFLTFSKSTKRFFNILLNVIVLRVCLINLSQKKLNQHFVLLEPCHLTNNCLSVKVASSVLLNIQALTYNIEQMNKFANKSGSKCSFKAVCAFRWFIQYI